MNRQLGLLHDELCYEKNSLGFQTMFDINQSVGLLYSQKARRGLWSGPVQSQKKA